MRARIEDLAARQDLPWFEWKITDGLRRAGTPDPLYDTEKPLQALKTALGMQTEAIYLFHDLHRHFEDPALVRALRDVGQRFAADRRCLVLCAAELELPPDLRTCSALIHLDLPDAGQLKTLVVRTLKSLGAPREIRIDLSLPEMEQLIDSLRGLTLAFAEKRALTAAHVAAALRATVPLSRTCREAIEGLRRWATGRTVPADLPAARAA